MFNNLGENSRTDKHIEELFLAGADATEAAHP